MIVDENIKAIKWGKAFGVNVEEEEESFDSAQAYPSKDQVEAELALIAEEIEAISPSADKVAKVEG